MKVLRQGKTFSEADFEALASALRRVYRESRRILHIINGRVLVRWLDPLCSGGRALRFFEELRSALEEDEAWLLGIDKSRFYGNEPDCDQHQHRGATWLVWDENPTGCSDLRILCRDCQVASGANRQRELRHFEEMGLSEFAAFLREYEWGREDTVKLIRLWTEGRL